jgi:hypothetical protein
MHHLPLERPNTLYLWPRRRVEVASGTDQYIRLITDDLSGYQILYFDSPLCQLLIPGAFLDLMLQLDESVG